jgi:hypothetical protein
MVRVPPFCGVPAAGVLPPPVPPDELEPLPPQPAATAIATIGIESLNTLLNSSRMPPPRENGFRKTERV